MAEIVSFDDAKQVARTRREARSGGFYWDTRFIDHSRETPDTAQAYLIESDLGRVSRTHFHITDQFQVVVDGKGKLGRHDIAPYTVHFARAYTPYGPLVADATIGMSFLTLRARPDRGQQLLPEARQKLEQVAGRRPWQVTDHAMLPLSACGDMVMQRLPKIKNDEGLAGYSLSMKPGARTFAPDPSTGDGQYVAVLRGSLLHQDREYPALTMVFVGTREAPFAIHAGPAGLDALILNFPRVTTTATVTAIAPSSGLKAWQCALCAFFYDEAAGLPQEGIAPGTRWADVPDNWTCPDCAASKSDFEMVEVTTV